MAAGEKVAVVGPNGAGKTSLLRCVQGIHRDYQGDIQFNGESTKTQGVRRMARQSTLVAQQQDRNEFSLTVLEFLRLGLLPWQKPLQFLSGAQEQRIRDVARQMDLTQQLSASFVQLSGGEQQRVLIARALVQNVALLLLDEPVNHLDVYYQYQILQRVSRLPIGVVMTIHDLNLAARYCQRLLLIHRGEILANGSAEDVLQPALLESVFGLPCEREDIQQIPQIRFYPPHDPA